MWHLKTTFQDLQFESNRSFLAQVVKKLWSNEGKMYFLKITVGLNKWHTGSGLTSPEFPYKSMPKRMAAVIETQRGHTKNWAVYMQ